MSSMLSVPKGVSRKMSGNALLKIERATGQQSTLVCQFNPDELQINTQGKYEVIERQGKDSPILQFMGGSSSVLDVRLYFDTSTSYEIKMGMLKGRPKKEQAKDVSVYTNILLSMVRIEGEVCRPPVVTFCWGSLEVSGFVGKVSVKYTMFEKGGMPVRAEASFSLLSTDLEQLKTEELCREEKPDQTKCVVMSADSSLWDIAKKEYGNAGDWRKIAETNDIMNPLDVPAGMHLKVPPLSS